MAKPQQTNAVPENRPSRPDQGHQHDQNLSGTFVSVMILGAFLLVTWVGVFLLFLSRG
ncbi:cytochrome c oxidase subunit 2A [Paenibacillus allorhizosphaerae]|uniref:Cytochrome c oxidase subunit 2A n=1 Tax=Paenibacillus allorhizosphaerae TaxID=2849866 RepID=A0ABM8VKZ2_9BACL|nr:cytochrome c oxidase subunit 2A [Paenibacillus allorhizosphaerae]CAG7647702.1 hypothetical protein PAECIP111802_04043 [Paenibacillus allorhizosphaerae]